MPGGSASRASPCSRTRYRTLEEAIDTAWGIAARLRVAITVGKDRLSPPELLGT